MGFWKLLKHRRFFLKADLKDEAEDLSAFPRKVQCLACLTPVRLGLYQLEYAG